MRDASKRCVFSFALIHYIVLLAALTYRFNKILIGTKVKLILSNDQSKFIIIEFALSSLGSSEKMKNALKKFSILLLLAIGSIFIPVFHFILVPLFIILAFVFGYKAYSIQYNLHLGESCLCVQCKHPLKSQYFLNQEMRLNCEKCFSRYIVDPTNSI